MTFRVRLREFAKCISGASNETATQQRLLRVETDFAQGLLDCLEVGVRHMRDDEILPDGQPDFAGAI